MNRRGLLFAGAAAAVLILAGTGAAVAAHAGQSDAALLGFCATFHRAHAKASDKANPYRGWATTAMQDAIKQLHRMVPATEAGHRAKAVVAASLLAELHEHDERGSGPETRFALKAFRDWLGVLA